MKIEDQLTNLGLSKKLKELGVKQNSFFYWETSQLHTTILLTIWALEPDYSRDDNISAFSVAELGEMLLPIMRFPNTLYDFVENKEADYRALMLICSIENNLVSQKWRKQWLI